VPLHHDRIIGTNTVAFSLFHEISTPLSFQFVKTNKMDICNNIQFDSMIYKFDDNDNNNSEDVDDDEDDDEDDH
jgi:hypothetical protein